MRGLFRPSKQQLDSEDEDEEEEEEEEEEVKKLRS
jgi:hypothetical protein